MAADGSARTRWDAVVIGAGPAGAVSAAGLASSGMRTLLVERARFPRPKLCGGCLAPAGRRALSRLGMTNTLTSGADITSLVMIARGTQATLDIEPYTTLERSAFDTALVEHAIERGAVFRDGTRATVRDGDLVELEPVRQSGRSQTIEASVVVVADGICGAALRHRPEFRWRVAPDSRLGIGAVLDHRPPHATDDAISMVCAREGYVGAAPIGRGRWAVAAAVAPSLVRSSGPSGAIDDILVGARTERVGLPRAGIRGVGPMTRRRRVLARGRVLTVGDAAGYSQPLTGEGMSWSIECAARVVPFAHRAAAGARVDRAWAADCARILRTRRAICSAVCAVAARPTALAALLRLASTTPGAGLASRRLCWGSS